MPDKTKSLKIAGVVVLFNPDIETIKNIDSYLSQVDLLIAFDNSEIKNLVVINELTKRPNIKYIFNGNNAGIAAALNKAAAFAVENGYQNLLMMDQDTTADPNLVANYKEFLFSKNSDNIGILAPAIVYHPNDKITDIALSTEIEFAITSGSLLNLEAFKKAGPFQDNLFIDYVDYEYCLRLRAGGYKIIQVNSARIYHKLGNLELRNFLFKKVYITHHSPLRYYYRTRNRLFVYKQYISQFPSFVLKDCFVFVNELVKIMIFEKYKLAKYKMLVNGIIDFIRSKYGKFDMD